MNDPRRGERFSPPLPGSGPAGPQDYLYPPPVDYPAYADQAPYAPTYGGHIPPWAPSLNETSPTKQLPPYWQQDVPPSGQLPPEGLAPPPPGGPKSPRWLLIFAGVAVLLAVALVIALILVNNAIKTQTAVPPLPAMPETSSPTPTPSTRTSSPSLIPAPAPPTGGSGTPTETTGPAAMQDIVYNVTGDGRALSIVYIGTGDVIQTEFNVALPWSKQVSLSKSAVHPANVTVVNFGHNVTCSVTVAGVQVSQRVGVGLTICDARG
ncbi:MAG: MmpS family transport accessory protein [Mycobacterium sp.]|uniref:MmpS family transport accessory protein n=1 Tax=Mycobacterium sp. TaxID=1785 RepID=UPI003F9AB707